MNYTEALEFFVENGITLNEEQLENLKEASAFTRHMRNAADKDKKYNDALKELEGRSGDNVDKLRSKLQYKKDENIKDNRYKGIHPENYYRYGNELYEDNLRRSKAEFNNKVDNAHPGNTKGKNDHKTAGDYLAMQKAKKALED